MLATLVDVSALWNVAVFAFAATLAVVGAYGVGVLALDRMQGSTGRGPWPLVLVLCGVVTLAVLALGFWAMTQK